MYDPDTGLYYLQSRYYDPVTGRFVNSDIYCDTGTGSPLSTNMYAYCENNAVNYDDPCGHKPGKLFSRADEAIMDFADIYNKISIRNNWEYATFIYSVKIKKYFSSTRYYTVKMYSYYKPWTDKSKDSARISEKRNTKKYTLVAIAHTHAAYDPRYKNEEFSGGDISVARFYKLNMYVVTPAGKIKRYTYSTRKYYTFSYNTYHDYRTRNTTTRRTHKCSKCAN